MLIINFDLKGNVMSKLDDLKSHLRRGSIYKRSQLLFAEIGKLEALIEKDYWIIHVKKYEYIADSTSIAMTLCYKIKI